MKIIEKDNTDLELVNIDTDSGDHYFTVTICVWRGFKFIHDEYKKTGKLTDQELLEETCSHIDNLLDARRRAVYPTSISFLNARHILWRLI